MSDPEKLSKTPAPYAVGWSDEAEEDAAGAARADAIPDARVAEAPPLPAPHASAPAPAPAPARSKPAGPADRALKSPSSPPVTAAAPSEDKAGSPSAAPVTEADEWDPAPDAPGEAVAIPVAHMLDRYPALAQRSGLFRVGLCGGKAFEGCELACFESDRRLIYSGPKLTMEDKRVWEAVLAAAKQRGAGVEFPLPARSVATALGRSTGGKESRSIVASLKRLRQAEIDYQLPGGARGSARLVKSLRKAPGRYMASLDPALLPALYDDKQFRIDSKRRESLNSDLARWLHDFMSTHEAGSKWEFRLDRLADLCGADPDDSHFATNLEAALDELRDSCPLVLASHSLAKIGRERPFWRVALWKGSEIANFTWQAEEDRKAAAKQAAAAARKAARDGRRKERDAAKTQARGVGGVVL